MREKKSKTTRVVETCLHKIERPAPKRAASRPNTFSICTPLRQGLCPRLWGGVGPALPVNRERSEAAEEEGSLSRPPPKRGEEGGGRRFSRATGWVRLVPALFVVCRCAIA